MEPVEHGKTSLFTPFTLGRLELANRVVMAPMTRMTSPGHEPSDEVVGYYWRRAAGQVGLIITEGTVVDHCASNAYSDVPAFFGGLAEGGAGCACWGRRNSTAIVACRQGARVARRP